jgi:hypothetical protein
VVRIVLNANIRTIVVLTGGKVTEIYFHHLLSAFYFLVATHLHPDENVSILPPGDVNLGPIPSRQGLLEDNPYRAIGAACPSCNDSRPCT